MQVDEKDEKFLNYKAQTQQYDAKVPIFANHYDAIKRELERSGNWREDASILDIGCGLGLYAEYWQSRGLKVTAVDLNKKLIDIAKESAEKRKLEIDYFVCPADDLPFAEEQFNIIFANSLLEHVPGWQKHLEEWVRVLSPGGVIWVETNNTICPFQKEFRWLPLYSWWPRPLKRIAENLARNKFPALANYTRYPAINWFSYFKLKAFFVKRGLTVRDRFDAMDSKNISAVRKILQKMAQRNKPGRVLVYLLTTSLIVFAHKDK